MQRFALIVAGGKGERMGTQVPKQFLLLAGKPVLMHTLQRFYEADASAVLLLVLPKEHQSTWKELCTTYNFTVPHRIVHGGTERFYSVQNGLQAIDQDEGVVAVHDGVRPLIDESIISKAYAQAESLGSAIVVVNMKDSVRELTAVGSRMADRSKLMLVQTPQVFRLPVLRKAYAVDYNPKFTDDASVVEAAGGNVELLQGDYRNIKITTTEDLIFAEAMLSRHKKS